MKHLSAICLAALLTASGSEAIAAQWWLKAYNVDDFVELWVNNVFRTQCTFNQTCIWNLNNYLVPGNNTVQLRVRNTVGGYTWGYILTKDRETFAEGACGITGFVGCNGNSFRTGYVYNTEWWITR